MKIFRTITDSELKPRNGQAIDVLGPVDPATYDFEDVGPMSHIRFPDGTETDAFDDEIHDDAPPALKEPWCAHVLLNTSGSGGEWMVAYVEEGEAGYYATTYTGERDYCKSVATEINKTLGVTDEKAIEIVMSSMRAGGNRG